VEDMQPLYYFNVKPQRSPDTVSEEDDEAEVRLPLRKLNVPKEASTPFFLGSPVNNQFNQLLGGSNIDKMKKKEHSKMMGFVDGGYDSFGEQS
jgi:hypothetical protein